MERDGHMGVERDRTLAGLTNVGQHLNASIFAYPLLALCALCLPSLEITENLLHTTALHMPPSGFRFSVYFGLVLWPNSDAQLIFWAK